MGFADLVVGEVGGVALDGMTEGPAVDSDLVGSALLGPDLDEGGVVGEVSADDAKVRVCRVSCGVGDAGAGWAGIF